MVFLSREHNVVSLNLKLSIGFPTTSAKALLSLVTRIRKIDRIVAATRIIADHEKCNINIKLLNNHLRLTMVKENLYIISYKNNLQGTWEMIPAGIENINRINGSTPLGFQVNYSDIEDLTYSFESFVHAVQTLISTQNPHQNTGTIKSCLFRIIITIIESSRFGWIMDSFFHMFRKNVSMKLTWLPDLVRGWKVLTQVANRCEEEKVILNERELKVKRKRDLVELFGDPRIVSRLLGFVLIMKPKTIIHIPL